ncbi:Ribosomal protein S5 [Giardia muris]|uniref:Ribosomal protein S5 n=1 Tax=Giardia muris TaxID=5742 RepID=A0A4Z1SPU3_GIAMU|nr:Ribosomal protein S5 [Giardia muris]|eukprot:TNJ27826.1 Ribosomal protein S5 [Giardia muris]
MDLEVKVFQKWPLQEIECPDETLRDYIAIENHGFIPHSAGRWSVRRFHKASCPIVERLTNTLMMHGRNSGKKLMAVKTVSEAFELVNLYTGKNPIQVLVEAIANAGPREDSCRIGRGSQVRRQSVDVSPLRRVNIALYNIAMGARRAAFRKVRPFSECLADEIMNCAAGADKSYAVTQRNSVERVAVSNR